MRWMLGLMFVFLLGGCASTITLKNGQKIEGDLSRGYESTVYVHDVGHIPRNEIKRVSHPSQMVFMGMITLGATLAAMYFMTPKNTFDGNGWQRWKRSTGINYVFLTGMGLSSAFIYGGLEVYDESVATFNERLPDPPKDPIRVKPSLFYDEEDEYAVPGLQVGGEF